MTYRTSVPVVCPQLSNTMMKLLFLSTPVGPLGSGLGGGVELTLSNVSRAISQRGHTVQVVAPQGSTVGEIPVIQIEGELQKPIQTQDRATPIPLYGNSVLANMWEYARQVQFSWDLIVNFGYDWLPLYLTPFFERPVAHLITMGSLSDAMDQMIHQVVERFPGALGTYCRAQAETFGLADRTPYLAHGLDLSRYHFCPNPGPALAWVGRIAPEKGLEDAVAASHRTSIPLKIFGLMQDQTYWQQIQRDYPDAPAEYKGFLPTAQLQQELGQCQALLTTPRWVEAYPNVALESLACGVPVISYRRGGLGEIIREGETGWLVEPDSVDGLVQAIGNIGQLDRHACRQQAETDYSLEALGRCFEAWFQAVQRDYRPNP